MSESGLPTPPGKVKRGLSGMVVQFKCPACGESLRNPLNEAGRSDRCPECGAGFTVPCSAEREAAEAQHAEESRRRHEAEAAAAKRKQAELLAASGYDREAEDYVPTSPPVRPNPKRKDENPGFIRIIGAVLIALGIVLAIVNSIPTGGVLDEPTLVDLFTDLGHTIANATIFLAGVLTYATGTMVRVMYQIRDR